MEQKPSLRTFYTLTITQMLSLLGSVMSGFAMALWIFDHTGKVTPLLLVAFFGALPTMIGAVWRVFSRIAWNAAKLIVFLRRDAGYTNPVLYSQFCNGTFRPVAVISGVVVQATFGMLQAPAVEASITMLVTENQRDRANAIRQMIGPFCDLCAPILVAFLYTFLRVEGILLIDLLTFILAVGVIIRLHIPQPAQTAEGKKAQGSTWSEMRGGLRFLLDRRPCSDCVSMHVHQFFSRRPAAFDDPYVLT